MEVAELTAQQVLHPSSCWSHPVVTLLVPHPLPSSSLSLVCLLPHREGRGDRRGAIFLLHARTALHSTGPWHTTTWIYKEKRFFQPQLFYRQFCPWQSATSLTKRKGHFERYLKIAPVEICLQWGHMWNTANCKMQWNPWLQPQQGISGRTLQLRKQFSCYFIRQPTGQPNRCPGCYKIGWQLCKSTMGEMAYSGHSSLQK